MSVDFFLMNTGLMSTLSILKLNQKKASPLDLSLSFSDLT